MTDEERLELIRELWEEHNAASFPKGLRGLSMENRDFVMLDADMAGCISTFLSRKTLDTWRLSLLALDFYHVHNISSALHDEAVSYFWRLGRIAELIFEHHVAAGRPD